MVFNQALRYFFSLCFIINLYLLLLNEKIIFKSEYWKHTLGIVGHHTYLYAI